MDNTMQNVTDCELHELFVAQLKMLLWAEKEQIRTLPEQAELAKHMSLKRAFENHFAVTVEQVSRLETIFYLLNVAPRPKVCRAIEGLLAECSETINRFAASPALDAALICSAQKIEHYEIATYGTLHAFAEQLGLAEARGLISLTLRQEIACDRRLSQIATGEVNIIAAAH